MSRFRRLHLLPLLTILSIGCARSLPPAADADQARTAVETMLDAWKQGENETSLQARKPAIHVNDPEWRSGARLVKYEIRSNRENGISRRCEVLLTTQHGSASPQQREASYTIDTDPAIVVVRD